MRYIFLCILSIFIFRTPLIAQDLPNNPDPGKCYVRCTTTDIYKKQTIEVVVTPSYKIFEIIPAEFKTVTEQVLITPETKSFKIIPNTWKTENVNYVKTSKRSSLKIIPASFSSTKEKIEIKSAYAQWELGAPSPDCASSNPDDCRYWCYKGYPAEYGDITVRKLSSDATVQRFTSSSQLATYTKRVVDKPARVEEIMIPAIYSSITKVIKTKNEEVKETIVPAETKTVTKEVLVSKGGLSTWTEVSCDISRFENLDIVWSTGSATLSSQSQAEVDEILLPLLISNPETKVEINVHTDARGSSSSNQSISERRAKSIINYLISKGVQSRQAIANGFGERQLKNRCADGVNCSEQEHLENRRTEYKIIKGNPVSASYQLVLDTNLSTITERNNLTKRVIIYDQIIKETLTGAFPLRYELNEDEVYLEILKKNANQILLEGKIIPKQGFFSDIQQSPYGTYIAVSEGRGYQLYDNSASIKLEIREDLILSDWSDDETSILFYKTTTGDGHTISNSEIYLFDLVEEELKQITFTEDIIEVDPKFGDNKTIIFFDEKDNTRKTISYD